MKDADFKDAVKNVEAEAVDFVESKLFQLIEGVTVSNPLDEKVVYKDRPCKTSIIFYLKTKAKDRGYVERQEQVLDFGEDAIKKLSVKFINGKDGV
jgi:hypothetical protein